MPKRKSKQSKITKLCPAFMTGGGGENFETHVAAVFVLSLLIDGLSPIVEIPIKELKFQAKNCGYALDDLVVTAEKGEKARKLLCQVKHNVTITAANKVFQDIINAAWADFNNSWFNKQEDRLALITSFIAKESIDALRYLHDQAHSCISGEEFATRITQASFTSKTRKEKYEIIKKCIKKANDGVQVSDEVLWHFCRCFVLVVFDLDYERSINQALIHSLIKCKSNTDAKLVWSRITEKCGYWKQAAATVTKEYIPEDILELFGEEASNDAALIPVPPTFSPTSVWATAALVGAWNEKNTEDVLAVEKLAGTSYDSFQRECRQHLDSGIISLNDGEWRVINRVSVVEAVRDSYFDDTIQTAFQIAEKYLKETSKQFTERGEFSIVIPASGRFSNSEVFRKGLLEGLCLLTNGRKPAYCSDHLLETNTVQLVNNVLGQCDWTKLVSLANLVLLLGELCPSAYLTGLEKLIHNAPCEILQLFPKKNALFSDHNFITNILFSLERLAWHKDYLIQAVSCLSALESLEYEETNWANTPMNSMVSILNPFITQTTASLSKLKSAIQVVNTDYADVCWNLCCKMLSHRCINGMTDNPHPKYLLRNEQCLSPLSGEERDELHRHYIQQVLSMVGTTPDRMKKIAENLSVLPPDEFKTFLEKIRSASLSWNDDEKSELWSQLTDWKYRIVSDNSNSEPTTPEFSDLCSTIDALRPENILSRYKRLFKFHYNEFSNSDNRWEQKEQQKQEAIIDIYQTYGLGPLVEFSESLNKEHDIGYRLGQQITKEDMSLILSMCKTGQNEPFYMNVIRAFFKKNGIGMLKEIIDFPEDFQLISFIFRCAPFTQELIELVPKYLPGHEEMFWKAVQVPTYYSSYEDYDAIAVAETLMQYHRTPAAIILISDAINDLHPDPHLICNMLVQAPNEQQVEKIDPVSTRELIKYLQVSDVIERDILGQIEFFYLVWLDEYSEVKPKAIEFLLANDPACFCKLMETAYRKRNDLSEHKNLPEAISERIFQITFQYNIIPGTDWEGAFHCDVFEKWMKQVIAWARENDRFEVSMHTVGQALSYVKFDETGVIHPSIMAELNKFESAELRRGYELGTFNQRGVCSVDPEGKPEKELAEKYQQRAESVEALGYSRFAESLRNIAAGFLAEAKRNIQRLKRHEDV